MVSTSGALEEQPVHFVVRQRSLTERRNGISQFGHIGLDEAVDTRFVFLEPYLSTIVKHPQSILALPCRNVRPALHWEN